MTYCRSQKKWRLAFVGTESESDRDDSFKLTKRAELQINTQDHKSEDTVTLASASLEAPQLSI